jgi:lipid A 4'-phosphatase
MAAGRIRGLARGLVRYVMETPPVWIPLLLLGALTLMFRLTDIDLQLAQWFFRDSIPHWPLGETPACLWLYNYGIYPAWILGFGGLAVWALALSWRTVRPFRDEGLFLFLVLILGPGLLVNCVAKPYFGRPRPLDTKPFGGPKEYLPVLATGADVAGVCNSFPSGHASTGFYLMAPAFVLYRRRTRWAAAFLLIGLAAGCTMGLVRMAAGGHFASDVVWAGGIVYFTALLLAAAFRFSTRGKTQG